VASVAGATLDSLMVSDVYAGFTNRDIITGEPIGYSLERRASILGGFSGGIFAGWQLASENGLWTKLQRRRAAWAIKRFRKDMRKLGYQTQEINSYVRAFELPTFRYGRNLNPFKRYYRHFTLGQRISGRWVHSSTELLNASPLERKIKLALPASNTAEDTAWTHIPFMRRVARGIVAHQEEAFTGLSEEILTGGIHQTFVPTKFPGLPFPRFFPVKSGGM